MIGKEMHNLAKRLFPINRSLTGKGVVETLNILKEYNPNLKIHSIKSGSKVFDWEVPNEWNCEEAYIITPDGEKICDYNQNNLHLFQYSIPIEKEVSFEELEKHLYSLENLPDAIPYVTSYYNKKWGFCIADKERKKLKKGIYKVVVKIELKKGLLHYADIGVIDFTNIRNEKAEIGLYKNPSKQKVGFKLMSEIINYGFNELKLKKLILYVYENNKRAINLYKKFNFKEVDKKNDLIKMELINETL
jgi:aminopeptidase-like protein